MTDTAQTGLKTIVERAVRPVRATIARKRKMREELLGHVAAVFDEELARSGDEAAALAETARRFGDPGEVAAGLQRTVPRFDRLPLLFERMTQPRPGESAVRRAVRWAAFITAANAATVATATIPFSGRLWRSELIDVTVQLVGTVAAASALLTFAYVLLGEALRRTWFVAPADRSPVRAAAALVGSAAVTAAVPLVISLVFLGTTREGLPHLRRTAPMLPLVPAVLAVAVWQLDKERRYVREWAELRVD